VTAGIAATTITHQVQTRFRVDEKKKIPYARTEHNLLEIIEAKDFAKKFDQYAIVKPRSAAAASIKQAYGLAATAGATDEHSQQQQQQPSSEETPASEPDTAATTETDASGDAAAEPVVSAPVPPREFVAPAGQPLPQSLANHHVHLVHLDHTRGTALSVEHNSRVSSRIRAAVANFLEDNLDETVLLFHKDVPDIKTKLCVDVTEVCKPRDNNNKAAAAAEKGGGKKGGKAAAASAKKQQKKKHHDAAEAAVAAAAAAVTAAATPTPPSPTEGGAAADAHPLKEEL
jgi:hypothetical protein